MKTNDLDIKKQELENQLLQLQVNNYKKNNKPKYINSTAVIVSIIISAATLVFGYLSQKSELRLKEEQTKQLEIQEDIKTSLKLVSFLLDNHDELFSEDTTTFQFTRV